MLPEPFNPFRFFPGVKFVYQLPDPELTEVEESAPSKTICEEILEDIKNLPIEGWEYDTSKGVLDDSVYYYHFEHKRRNYRLHGCLWGDRVPNMTLSGISKYVFTRSEQLDLTKALNDLKDRMTACRKAIQEKEDGEKLKKLFPNCKTI